MVRVRSYIRTAIPYRDLGDAATAEAFFAPRVRDLFPIIYPIATRAVQLLTCIQPATTPLLVLDVGAGSAPWSAAFIQQYPQAHVTAIDLPTVVEQGYQQIQGLGITRQYTWKSADMESFLYPPETYDVIFAGHICRFMSDERAIALLGKLVRSLRVGGYLLIADVFLPEDGSNAAAITLDLSMLVNTAHGRIRTCGEVIEWLNKCNLFSVQQADKIGPFPILLARKNEDDSCEEL